MNYLNFEKKELTNLSFALNKEILRSNFAGSFASTTIIGCNTRKYHGLLISPQKGLDAENHLLLSAVDETIIADGKEFNLGIRKYPGGVYEPKGHKYMRNFEMTPVPGIEYRIGKMIFMKETVLVDEEERILIRYTLKEASGKITLRINPFLAFRNIHKLSKANVFVLRKYLNIKNGIKTRMYLGYPYLNMQFSKKSEYISNPNWYYNVTYDREMERGYEYTEDLFVPGFFEFEMKKGESVVFSVGLSEIETKTLKRKFTAQTKLRIPRDSFENCLENAAKQFIYKDKKKTKIIAGYPWFGVWGRDTFISLPGLTLSLGNPKLCKSIIDTTISEEKNGLIPNMGNSRPAFNSVDAPLWLFWSIQKYAEYTKEYKKIWKEYKKKLIKILNLYKTGTNYNIGMGENFLIHAGEKGVALTWMDAIVEGKPVTPRTGFCVEINALWYNAIKFCLEMAEKSNDKKFIKEWKDFPEKIEKSFNNIFSDENHDYLADFVSFEGIKNWDLRPNQIMAISLPYSPIKKEKADQILKIVKKHLLTPRGLRTLSPQNASYKPIYCGNQTQRDLAYHQGTVWPWLLGHFCEAYLKTYKLNGIAFIKEIYNKFSEVMSEHGLGTISEIYDGNFPHAPKGAISQAWSVSEVLRIGKIIENMENRE